MWAGLAAQSCVYLKSAGRQTVRASRRHIQWFTFMPERQSHDSMREADGVEASDIKKTRSPCPLASGLVTAHLNMHTCLLACAHTWYRCAHTKIWSVYLWSLCRAHTLPAWFYGKCTLEEKKAGKLWILQQISGECYGFIIHEAGWGWVTPRVAVFLWKMCVYSSDTWILTHIYINKSR